MFLCRLYAMIGRLWKHSGASGTWRESVRVRVIDHMCGELSTCCRLALGICDLSLSRTMLVSPVTVEA